MRQENEGAGHRHPRLEGLILEELRALLRDDVVDPALAEVRLTSLVLSVDYRYVRVHFIVLDSGQPLSSARQRAERGFVRVTPFLRARLADSIDMKRVPDLRFVFDGTAPAGAEEESCTE